MNATSSSSPAASARFIQLKARCMRSVNGVCPNARCSLWRCVSAASAAEAAGDVVLVFMVDSAFKPLGPDIQRLPHARCPAVRRLGIQRCVPTLGAAVKGVVARHQHIALRDDDLAPVAGRAVVLAWWGWDGHGFLIF